MHLIHFHLAFFVPAWQQSDQMGAEHRNLESRSAKTFISVKLVMAEWLAEGSSYLVPCYLKRAL